MDDAVRVDQWVWAVRLAKTRQLSAEAARGGRVHVNGAPAKPAREVKVGDHVRVTINYVRREVVVRGLARRRVSAAAAAELYEETAESVAARERIAEQRRLERLAAPQGGARPTKRDRRRLERATGRGRR